MEKTGNLGEPVLQKILALKISNYLEVFTNNQNNKGFTLMEIMVVLAIISAIVGMALPKIGNRNNEVKAEVRKLSTLTRQIRSQARMNNVTYRLVLDLGEEDNNTHSYWLERANKEILLTENREDEYLELLDAKDTEETQGDPSGFAADTSILKKAKKLPRDMYFENIELPGYSKPLAEGKVYIHFFPSGRVEEAAIHLKLEEFQWTLVIHPLTGKTDIANQYVNLKDITTQ